MIATSCAILSIPGFANTLAPSKPNAAEKLPSICRHTRFGNPKLLKLKLFRRTASGRKGCAPSLVIQPEKLPNSKPPLKILNPTTVSFTVGLLTLSEPTLTMTA